MPARISEAEATAGEPCTMAIPRRLARRQTLFEAFTKARRNEDVVVGADGHHEEIDDDGDGEVQPHEAEAVDEDQGDHPERGHIGEHHADEQVDGGDERTEQEGQDDGHDAEGQGEDVLYVMTQGGTDVHQLGGRPADQRVRSGYRRRIGRRANRAGHVVDGADRVGIIGQEDVDERLSAGGRVLGRQDLRDPLGGGQLRCQRVTRRPD